MQGIRGERWYLHQIGSIPIRPTFDISIMDFGYDIPDFDPDDYDNYNYD